jgi:hypothetical protein
VFFPEDNQIDTGQKIARKGRTDFDDTEVGRKAERQGVGVQDIINNIVSLLGGNSQKGLYIFYLTGQGDSDAVFGFVSSLKKISVYL